MPTVTAFRAAVLAIAVLGVAPARAEDPAAATKDASALALAWSDGGLGVDPMIRGTFHVLTSANVRSSPGPQGQVLGWIAKGARLKVYGVVRGRNWYAVGLNGKLGFVSGELVAPEGRWGPLPAAAEDFSQSCPVKFGV